MQKDVKSNRNPKITTGPSEDTSTASGSSLIITQMCYCATDPHVNMAAVHIRRLKVARQPREKACVIAEDVNNMLLVIRLSILDPQRGAPDQNVTQLRSQKKKGMVVQRRLAPPHLDRREVNLPGGAGAASWFSSGFP